jgi:carbon-monoxide dehydrogenase large subunit
MSTTIQRSPMIGRPLRRVEDHRLLTGGGAFISDLVAAEPRALHVAFVRSAWPHARLAAIDTGAAAALLGVVRVVTGADLRDLAPLPPPGPPFLPDFPPVPAHPVLPAEYSHFAGEPIAAVVAETAALARDAADLVAVEYEPLAAIVDAEEAARAGSPRVHANLDDNVVFRRRHVAGDPDAAFGRAARTIRLRLAHARVAAIPIEARGVLAQIEPATGRLLVRLSTQSPFLARADLARVLGMDLDRVRVVAPDVGGAFGAKGSPHAEEFLVAALARQLDRPVAWVSSRSEDLQSTTQGRDMCTYAEAAVTSDGTILALRLRSFANLGAYAAWYGPLPPMRLLQYPTGCYRIEHLDTELTLVLTNTAPTGPYRGAGRPEAAFIAERLIDRVAAEFQQDPVEIRRKHFVPPEAFPYTNAGGVTYDSGNYAGALGLALERAGYADLRCEQAARRLRGELVGIGLATYMEPAGGGWEGGQVQVEPDGQVTAYTGSSAHGQGHQTTFAQIVADKLGVDWTTVRVVSGDTDSPVPGIGSFGSRSVVLGGSALAISATAVRERALRVAAALLEVAVHDLELHDSRVRVRGAGQRELDLATIAQAARRGVGLTPDEPHALIEATRFLSTSGDTFPFGACVALVSIAPDTAQATLERLVLVDDCGTVINPLLVDGQLAGGVAQGIGEALREMVLYSTDGQLITGSLLDYAVPRASDVPDFELERTETPSPRNPLGAKGVGESGTVGTPAAIANAVVDALRSAGVDNVDLPIRTEDIWQLLSGRRAKH